MGGKKKILLDAAAEWLDSVELTERDSEKSPPPWATKLRPRDLYLESPLRCPGNLRSVEEKTFVIKADDELSERLYWALDTLDDAEEKVRTLGATDDDLNHYTSARFDNEERVENLRNFVTSGVLVKRYVGGGVAIRPLDQLEENVAKALDTMKLVQAIYAFESKWGGEPYAG